MNTGAEAVETALKICRKWGYEVKGIPENQAQIIVCENNFHGRTKRLFHFQMMKMHVRILDLYRRLYQIAYDDTDALEAALKSNVNIAGFLVEPIQGEAGVYVPTEGYL
jgi:ornithine--oxo-acid transaminase